MSKWFVEAIGLAGSFFILFSFIHKGEKTIRRINLIGCVLFTLYGVFIQSYSVSIMNGITGVIQVKRLLQSRG